ncbi:hypothetical protein CLF_104911 [Clonorchis sinensis]|uniref:Uncharacterized protein n=1 Tax=Clonorchis sinensis TaxID=79923 RepID=G7YCK4_CLOSI|nr:hypothetical protein CLF_104911 [Clonorchis sinensis]
MGDRKIDEALFKQPFLKRLPTHEQSILASSSDVPLSGLASTAGKILEIQPCSSTISSVDTPVFVSTFHDRPDKLTKQVEATRLPRPYRFYRALSRPRSHSTPRSPSTGNGHR